MNNTKLTHLLRNGKEEKAFTKLYSLYPKVEKYILINSGSKAEALDVFQEGLIILFNKSKTNTELVADGFLIKTCKYLWQNQLRKNKVRYSDDAQLNELIEDNSELELLIEKENKLNEIEAIVKKISKKCRQIFELFYFKSMRMTQVAEIIGYKSVQSAKVQKYKCMEQARNLALANEHNINLKH